MGNHSNRSRSQPVTDVKLIGDTVEFSANGTRWAYRPRRGSLYIGGAGTVIHNAPDGSFDFGMATGASVALHAKLLGAAIGKR